MKSSRRKMLSIYSSIPDVTCSQNLRLKVDDFLASEYSAWRDRIRKDPHSKLLQNKQIDNENSLLMEYVRYVYEEYGITDPLQIQDRIDQDHDEPQRKAPSSKNLTSRPSVNFTESKTQKKTHKKTASIFVSRTLFTRDEEINEERETEKKNSNLSRHRREISDQKIIPLNIEKAKKFRTEHSEQVSETPIQKIKFLYGDSEPTEKDLTSTVLPKNMYAGIRQSQAEGDTPSKQKPESSQNENHYGENLVRSEIRVEQRLGHERGFKRKINSLSLRQDQPIPEIYRYCLACENAVLEDNIQAHEVVCPQFKNIYEMNLGGILDHLQVKINQIGKRINIQAGSLADDDVQNMKSLTRNLSQESFNIFKSGCLSEKFVDNYNEAINISKKWGETTEEINKLRWFVRVRENLKSHFGI